MNKILTISVIVLVAVIMGMSAMAPAMAGQPDPRPANGCDGSKHGFQEGSMPFTVWVEIVKVRTC